MLAFAVRIFAPLVCASLVLFSFARPARANGRYPAANELVVAPGNPDHLVLRATYGLLQSFDGGATWTWACEGAVGYDGDEDPALAVSADGTVMAASSAGLDASHDRGCSWSVLGDVLDRVDVGDVTVDPSNPSRVLAAITIGSKTAGSALALATSDDDARTFQPLGGVVKDGFRALTVDIAPASSGVIYVTGSSLDGMTNVVLHSSDSGATFSSSPAPGPSGASAYLGGIDPNDANRVYVRVTSYPDQLFVSKDGALTFTQLFAAKGPLLGLALSPDNTQIALGGPDDGLWIGGRDGPFQKTSALRVQCLRWTEDGLFACGDDQADGFSLGLSTDGGASFRALYRQRDLAPLLCDADSPVAEICASSWSFFAPMIGADGGADAASPSASAAPGLNPVAPDPPSAHGGCALGARVAASPPWPSAALLFCAWAWGRARRALRVA